MSKGDQDSELKVVTSNPSNIPEAIEVAEITPLTVEGAVGYVKLIKSLANEVIDYDTPEGEARAEELARQVVKAKTTYEKYNDRHAKDLKEAVKIHTQAKNLVGAELDSVRDDLRRPMKEKAERAEAMERLIKHTISAVVDLSTLPSSSSSEEITAAEAEVERIRDTKLDEIDQDRREYVLTEISSSLKILDDMLAAALAREEAERKREEELESLRVDAEAKEKALADSQAEIAALRAQLEAKSATGDVQTEQREEAFEKNPMVQTRVGNVNSAMDTFMKNASGSTEATTVSAVEVEDDPQNHVSEVVLSAAKELCMRLFGTCENIAFDNCVAFAVEAEQDKLEYFQLKKGEGQ